jgi:transcriptional regulator with XRE-family HTH domain
MLAKFVHTLRKKHELSQEFLAKELGLSRPSYLLVEQGKKELTISEAQKLANIFGMSLEDFLHGEEMLVYVHIKKSPKTKATKPNEIRISIPAEKVDKFKQVLLYVLKKVGGKPNVGMTVLYKLLYFIDFDFYEKYEEQLMGAVYIKNHHGPTPVMFKKIIDDMIANKEIEAIKSEFYKYPQTKYLINPHVEPNLSVLNGLEKDHIDWELTRLSDLTAKELSDLSHRDVPWLGAKEREQLDYEAVFYRTHETSVRQYDDED